MRERRFKICKYCPLGVASLPAVLGYSRNFKAAFSFCHLADLSQTEAILLTSESLHLNNPLGFIGVHGKASSKALTSKSFDVLKWNALVQHFNLLHYQILGTY